MVRKSSVEIDVIALGGLVRLNSNQPKYKSSDLKTNLTRYQHTYNPECLEIRLSPLALRVSFSQTSHHSHGHILVVFPSLRAINSLNRLRISIRRGAN